MDRTRLNTKKSACVKTTAKVFSVIRVLLGSSTAKAIALGLCCLHISVFIMGQRIFIDAKLFIPNSNQVKVLFDRVSTIILLL